MEVNFSKRNHDGIELTYPEEEFQFSEYKQFHVKFSRYSRFNSLLVIKNANFCLKSKPQRNGKKLLKIFADDNLVELDKEK